MVPHVNASVAHSEMRQAALRTGGLPVLEDITHSPQRSDQRRLTVSVNLAAQPINMHVDYVGVGLDAHAPNLIKDHGACDHPAGVPAQELVIVGLDGLVNVKSPEVLVHVAPGVNVVAPEDSSFAGGSCTHILNVQIPEDGNRAVVNV